MRLSYSTAEPSDAAKAAAEKIVSLIISDGLTYGQADEALTEAQRLLGAATRPVSAGILPQGGSEQNP